MPMQPPPMPPIGSSYKKKYVAPEVFMNYLRGRQPSRLQKEDVIDWMKKNPGWVGKNWKEINKTQHGRDTAKAARYYVKDDLKANVTLFNPDVKSGKTLWRWGRKKKAEWIPGSGVVTEPDPKAKPKPSGAAGAGASTTAPTTGSTEAPEAERNWLLDAAIKRLTGLTPGSVGSMLDSKSLLSGLQRNTATRTSSLNQTLKSLQQEREHNLGAIDKWLGLINTQVGDARTAGTEMQQRLAGNLQGNNEALLASIGGDAAIGGSMVAESGQQGANMLAALGQADTAFLDQMAPLLQAEGMSLKSSEQKRIGQLSQDVRQQIMETLSQGGTERAQLAMEIANSNNSLAQQRYSNKAAIAETLSGLGMSQLQMSAAQRKAVQQAMVDLAKVEASDRKYQAQEANRNGRAAASSMRSMLAAAAADLMPPDDLQKMIENDPNAAGQYKTVMGYAPAALVQQVVGSYVAQGLDPRNPTVRNAIVAAIGRYGRGKVNPNWISQWAKGEF